MGGSFFGMPSFGGFGGMPSMGGMNGFGHGSGSSFGHKEPPVVREISLTLVLCSALLHLSLCRTLNCF